MTDRKLNAMVAKACGIEGRQSTDHGWTGWFLPDYSRSYHFAVCADDAIFAAQKIGLFNADVCLKSHGINGEGFWGVFHTWHDWESQCEELLGSDDSLPKAICKAIILFRELIDSGAAKHSDSWLEEYERLTRKPKKKKKQAIAKRQQKE